MTKERKMPLISFPAEQVRRLDAVCRWTGTEGVR